MSKKATNKKSRGSFDGRGSGNFRILGLQLQDIIKAFFGGNAAIAVVVIALICFFLAREAYQFFPDYRAELEVYRKSGQEFVGFIDDEASKHQEIKSLAFQAYGYEIYHRTKQHEQILEVYNELRNRSKTAAKGVLELRQRAFDKGDSIAAELDPKIKEAAEAEYKAHNTRAEKVISEYLAEFTRDDLSTASLSTIPKEDFELVKKSVSESMTSKNKEDAEFILETKMLRDAASEAAAKALEPFYAGVMEISAARNELDKMIKELRPHALKTKQFAVAYESAEARKEALAEGSENATSEERRARLEIESKRVLTTPPNYEERNQILYDSIEAHSAAADSMLTQTRSGVAKLDASMLKSQDAIDRVAIIQKKSKKLSDEINKTENALRVWNHKEPYSGWKTFFGFFFGQKWVTNSTWQDFYGLAPLFSGSLIIAVIAIVISVPFSIGAAIYVNQIATQFEKTAIKPILEFIGAIPSIVLGLFGILVLGDFLQKVSAIEWLANLLPGFPIESRLNMLNAGLLLAFMAVPTIFTLAEDALNNVPRAHSEASLALGATKMQTVLKVVFPAAISGILAAVLLGFGRVIGETMVVLLVAGNRISVPDFTAGLGVITQPAHTMTGIIAQEMGEVGEGTLHWRALFMVGLILFLISLSLNWAAQSVIRKFSRHH